MTEKLASDAFGAKRFDAEHFRPQFDELLSRINRQPDVVRLGDILAYCERGSQPEYADEGSPVINSKHVRMGSVSLSEENRLARKDAGNPAIKHGDILINGTGVGTIGRVAFYADQQEAIPDNHVTILRLKPEAGLDARFLAMQLAGSIGQLQTEQHTRGSSGQVELYPDDIRKFLIFRGTVWFQNQFLDACQNAERLRAIAATQFAAAERTLLHTLGLDNWRPPDPLSYVRCASEVAEAARFDAEFFTPRTVQLLAMLGAGERTIRDVAPPRHEDFTGAGGPGEFDYIEIGSLRGDGTVGSERLACADAPSRATWLVRGGDVVTSTVRPNRRLSALITPEQSGCVASSGFVVLQPKAVSPEVLLTYLRLPPVCEVMDLHTSASLYPTISETDLLKLPFPALDLKTCDAVTAAVRAAHSALREAQALLARAQRAVEVAIEQGEAEAIKLLK